MWGWFFACRYACGGDTYFPASINAATRADAWYSYFKKKPGPVVPHKAVAEVSKR